MSMIWVSNNSCCDFNLFTCILVMWFQNIVLEICKLYMNMYSSLQTNSIYINFEPCFIFAEWFICRCVLTHIMPEVSNNKRSAHNSNKPAMKSVRRISVTDQFQLSKQTPIPDVPTSGARVKVKRHIFHLNSHGRDGDFCIKFGDLFR